MFVEGGLISPTSLPILLWQAVQFLAGLCSEEALWMSALQSSLQNSLTVLACGQQGWFRALGLDPAVRQCWGHHALLAGVHSEAPSKRIQAGIQRGHPSACHETFKKPMREKGRVPSLSGSSSTHEGSGFFRGTFCPAGSGRVTHLSASRTIKQEPQGRLRLPGHSVAALGAARLLRWCGKVGISSGSQAGKREETGSGSAWGKEPRAPPPSACASSETYAGASL